MAAVQEPIGGVQMVSRETLTMFKSVEGSMGLRAAIREQRSSQNQLDFL